MQFKKVILGTVTILVTFTGNFTVELLVPFSTAEILAQTSNPKQVEADRLNDLGLEQLTRSQFEAALQSFQQALAIYREISDRKNELAAQGNLAIVYKNLGNYPKAIEYYQQVLAIAREVKDRKSEGKTLGNLGNVYDSLGDYSKAIDLHQQYLAIARAIKYREGEGHALGGLGNAYLSLGDYPKTIDYHQQSLAIAREISDRKGEAVSLSSLGLTYWSLGDYPKAIDYHRGSLAIAREVKNPQSEGASLGSLGLTFQALGDYTKAIDYHQQHLVIARAIKDRQAEGGALGNLGINYLLLGDYSQAINNFKQHLAIAREIKDRQSEGKMLGNLGTAYGTLGNSSQAIEYFDRHLAIARSIKDRQSEGIALSNLGYELYKQGNLPLAESNLLAGINILESLRVRLKDSEKISIFDTQRLAYTNLQKVLIAQNKQNVALEISERGRARAFVELISSRLPVNPKNELKLSNLPTTNDLIHIAKAQNSTLVQYSIISSEFKVKGRAQFKQSELYIWVIKPTGEVLFRQSDLKPLWQQQNTSLSNLINNTRESLGVAIGTTRSANNVQSFAVGDWVRRNHEDFANDPAWEVVAVNPQERTVKIRMTTWEAREQSIERKFEQVTKVSSPYGADRNLQQLHKLTIEPIADLLPTDPNARVTFIPQGALFFVPFPALQDAQRNYLIHKHTILTAPSIQVLDLTRQKRQQILGTSTDVLVVGNPTMPKVSPYPGEPAKQLDPLPKAEIEAQDVAQLYKTRSITGDKATKSTILPLLPKARIIHLATHGLLADFTGGGIPGAVVLAPEPLKQGEDGRANGLLTANEIFDLKLNNTELVVLSACNTGGGIITGDGVIGLSRSLISAGVPSVVVSLWAIPDAPTASLMTEFYQGLQQGNDKAAALRQAMLKTMEKHPEPKNWAAFTLIGESGSTSLQSSK